MKKVNLFSTIVFVFGMLIASSCDKPNDPMSSADRLIEKYSLTRLSQAETNALLKKGNYLNFETAEEADEFLSIMREIGKRGGSFTRKIKPEQLKTNVSGKIKMDILFANSNRLKDLYKRARIGSMEDDKDPGIAIMDREWGLFADLRVTLTWQDNYTQAVPTANIESVANYNTWETEQGKAKYNSSTGTIDFTITGQVHLNLVFEGIGTFQSYNGIITGSYNPSTGESVVNWSY